MDAAIDIEAARCRYFLKAKPLYAVIDVVLQHYDILREGQKPHFKTVQRHLHAVTGTTFTVLYWDRKNDRMKKLTGLKEVPRKKFPRRKWQLVYVVAFVNVKRVLEFHNSRHPGGSPEPTVDVSYDGVKLTNSCGRSFECMSCKFLDCRQVYPVSVAIAEKEFSDLLTAKHVMAEPLRNLKKCGVHVRYLPMDHPKRCGELRALWHCQILHSWQCQS